MECWCFQLGKGAGIRSYETANRRRIDGALELRQVSERILNIGLYSSRLRRRGVSEGTTREQQENNERTVPEPLRRIFWGCAGLVVNLDVDNRNYSAHTARRSFSIVLAGRRRESAA